MPAKSTNLNTDEGVIIADSFDDNFTPLSLSTPRCLLPLANVPLIEYALENLAMSGMKEIYIVVSEFQDQIKEYIRQSKWANSTHPIVKFVFCQELRCIGDALRELDANNLIQSDFALMTGYTVCNVNLLPILTAHQERRAKDPKAIMTIVVREAGSHHPTRSKSEESIYVVDADSKEVVHYELFSRSERTKMLLDSQLFKDRSELLIKNDLIDCHVDICSLDVLALFQENFDYQNNRIDFLNGILGSELVDKKIFIHELSEGYAAQVSNLQMYHAITEDVLKRWTYPMSPDIFTIDGRVYHEQGRNIYKGEDVSLQRSVKLEDCVIVGGGTTIEHSTVVTNSVIGRNCTIGANVTIDGCYLMDNVVVEEGCQLHKSVFGEDCVILQNVVISRGSVIENACVVGPDCTLEPRTLVSYNDHQFEDNATENTTDLGKDSRGFAYVRDIESYANENSLERSFLDYESELAITDGEYDTDVETEGEIYESEEDETDWVKEVELTIERAFKDNHAVEIAVLELNTLKMAQNMTFKDLRAIVIPHILALIPADAKKVGVQKIIKRWMPIVIKFTHSLADQVDCLNVIVQFLLKNTAMIPKTTSILQYLYDIDLLEEDSIFEWYDTLEGATGALYEIREEATKYVDWLRESESESESD